MTNPIRLIQMWWDCRVANLCSLSGKLDIALMERSQLQLRLNQLEGRLEELRDGYERQIADLRRQSDWLCRTSNRVPLFGHSFDPPRRPEPTKAIPRAVTGTAASRILTNEFYEDELERLMKDRIPMETE